MKSRSDADGLCGLILAGGASARMGEDKAQQAWQGARAVDRLAGLLADLGAAAVFTVGTRAYGYPFFEDVARDGGPVSGLAAAFSALRGTTSARALVLAVDAPTVTPEDLAPLLAAPDPGAAFADLHFPFVCTIAAAPRDAGPGWSVGRFIAAAGLARLPCAADARDRLRGANTPEERAQLLRAMPPAPPPPDRP